MGNIIKFEDQQKEMQTLKAMAAIAVNSGKYGNEYNESTILNIFYTAKSLGVDPMVALNGGFNIIKGKINMSAHFMAALARRKGHSIKVIEMTDKKCIIIGQRKDNGDSLKYEYTWEEAVRSGLTGKDNWRNNPKQMLYCGCVRNVFRILFSDIGIAYDKDEMNVDTSREDVNQDFVVPVLEMEEYTQENNQEPEESTLSDDQIIDIMSEIGGQVDLQQKICKKYGVTNLSQINQCDFPTIMKKLQASSNLKKKDGTKLVTQVFQETVAMGD